MAASSVRVRAAGSRARRSRALWAKVPKARASNSAPGGRAAVHAEAEAEVEAEGAGEVAAELRDAQGGAFGGRGGRDAEAEVSRPGEVGGGGGQLAEEGLDAGREGVVGAGEEEAGGAEGFALVVFGEGDGIELAVGLTAGGEDPEAVGVDGFLVGGGGGGRVRRGGCREGRGRRCQCGGESSPR